jgi:hypothetical protein
LLGAAASHGRKEPDGDDLNDGIEGEGHRLEVIAIVDEGQGAHRRDAVRVRISPGDGPPHYMFAVALFLTLAYFSLCLFTKTDADEPTRRKRQRNKVYVTCGVAMMACILLIVVYMLCLRQTALAKLNPVFWLESLMLWAFGISWMTKGEAILKDLPTTP